MQYNIRSVSSELQRICSTRCTVLICGFLYEYVLLQEQVLVLAHVVGDDNEDKKIKWNQNDQRHLNLDKMHSDPVNLRRNNKTHSNTHKHWHDACDIEWTHLVHSPENEEKTKKETNSSLSSAWICFNVTCIRCDRKISSLYDKKVSTFHRRTEKEIFFSLSHRMRACLFSLI